MSEVISLKQQLNVRNLYSEEELEAQKVAEAVQMRKARKAGRKANKEKRRTQLVAYQFHADLDNMPKVGQSIAVCHRSEEDAKGKPRLVRTSIDFRVVAKVCMSDPEGYRVIDNQGEPWNVRPATIGSAKWETFYSGEKQKVIVK